MLILVERTFHHLSNSSTDSSVSQLSQAMSGGKTHSMIAFGLLAQSSTLRRQILSNKNPAPNLGSCHVVGFNGRSTDAPGGIWRSLAEQLGKAKQCARYVSPVLSTPGPKAWKQLLDSEPKMLFLDELPSYLTLSGLCCCRSCGQCRLGVVTTTALANLFVAVAEMSSVCLVIPDLTGSI